MWIFLKHSCSCPYCIQSLLLFVVYQKKYGFHPSFNSTYSKILLCPSDLAKPCPRGIVWCPWCFNPSFDNWKRRVYVKPRSPAPPENGKLRCIRCIFLRDNNCRGWCGFCPLKNRKRPLLHSLFYPLNSCPHLHRSNSCRYFVYKSCSLWTISTKRRYSKLPETACCGFHDICSLNAISARVPEVY